MSTEEIEIPIGSIVDTVTDGPGVTCGPVRQDHSVVVMLQNGRQATFPASKLTVRASGIENLFFLLRQAEEVAAKAQHDVAKAVKEEVTEAAKDLLTQYPENRVFYEQLLEAAGCPLPARRMAMTLQIEVEVEADLVFPNGPVGPEEITPRLLANCFSLMRGDEEIELVTDDDLANLTCHGPGAVFTVLNTYEVERNQ